MSWCLYVCFTRIYTNDTNPTALDDVNCLFSAVVYLGIQVAGVDAIFDCFTNVIGLFFYLRIVKSMPCNQACKRKGSLHPWLLCDIYSDVHVTCYVFIRFHLVA